MDTAGDYEVMATDMATEAKVFRFIVDNPRAELQQICVGVGLPVEKTQPAIAYLLTRELIVMSYGTGGAGTQYVAPNGQKILNDALGQGILR